MQLITLIKEFLEDINRQKLRAFLTITSITWGTLAIILLMAFGEGLGFRMQQSFMNAGDNIIRIYNGQTTKEWQGLPKGRPIRLIKGDADMVAASIPEIDGYSVQYNRGTNLRNGENIHDTHMEGVFPDFEWLRRMHPAPGGRFINDNDIQDRRRVVFLGGEIANDLFGKPNPVGETVLLDGIPFTIIGTMPKKMQTAMNNGPDDRRAIIPFTTFENIYGHRYISEIIFHTRNPLDAGKVIRRTREVLGQKYKFDPTDEGAVPMWDMVEMAKESGKFFKALNLFLGFVGFMTLVIAGVGVANIMYVVAKERTKEIGIKRAIGAKRSHILFQFIFESLLIATIGGTTGLFMALGIIKLIWMMPVQPDTPQEFLARPLVSPEVIIFSIAVLTVMGVLAGLFPARKASRVDPVEALRYE